jgi:6,7-dimethyl-8-ribityllumazine synthase
VLHRENQKVQVELDRTDIPAIPDARIAILQAKWYRSHVDQMVAMCRGLLAKAGSAEPEHHILPGSLELPLAAQALIRARAKSSPLDAVICFGAIMKGDTYHFEMISNECIRGLGEVILAEGVPIIVEVIPVTTVEQLIARSRDDRFNKGIEAALAAAEIIEWRRRALK